MKAQPALLRIYRHILFVRGLTQPTSLEMPHWWCSWSHSQGTRSSKGSQQLTGNKRKSLLPKSKTLPSPRPSTSWTWPDRVFLSDFTFSPILIGITLVRICHISLVKCFLLPAYSWWLGGKVCAITSFSVAGPGPGPELRSRFGELLVNFFALYLKFRGILTTSV